MCSFLSLRSFLTAGNSADSAQYSEQNNVGPQRITTRSMRSNQNSNRTMTPADFEVESDSHDELIDDDAPSTSNANTAKNRNKSRGVMPRGDDSDSFFTRNLLIQEENHKIQREVLLVQKQKVEVSLEREKFELQKIQDSAALSLERDKFELEKLKYELQMAKARDNFTFKAEQQMTAIELDKKKRLADLEIAAKQKELEKLS